MTTTQVSVQDVLRAADALGAEALRLMVADKSRAEADGLPEDEWAQAVAEYNTSAPLEQGLTEYLTDECGYTGEPAPADPPAEVQTAPSNDENRARTAARKLGTLKSLHRQLASAADGVASTVGALSHVKGASAHANQLIRFADRVAADTTKVHKAQAGLTRAADKFAANGGNGERLTPKADKGTTTFVIEYGDSGYTMQPADGRAVWSLLSGAPFDQNIDAAVTLRLLRRLPSDVNGRVKVVKTRESDGAEYTKQFVVHRGDGSVIVRVENPTKEDKDRQLLTADEYTLKVG